MVIVLTEMLIALMVSCFDGVLVSNMSCSTIVVIVTERAGGRGEGFTKDVRVVCVW